MAGGDGKTVSHSGWGSFDAGSLPEDTYRLVGKRAGIPRIGMDRPSSEPPVTRLAALRDSLRHPLESRLGVDARAVAAFRIGLGLVVLFDLLLLRVPGLGTFYTDDGVFPRSTLAEIAPTLARWSLHAISGSLWVQALLIGGTGVVAACLLVGYRPRLAAFASALLLTSLHARNPFLVNGGDTILISLLLLGAFLPLGARWAIHRRRTGERRIVSVATATVLLHVESIYAINALLKLRSDTWTSGIAVRRIFQLQDFVYLLGPTVAEYPAVLTAINWLWVALLFASVLLLVATDRLRILTVGAFVGAHLGMAVTIRLGAFPFVMITALLLFLPSQVWNAVERRVAESGFRATPTSVVDEMTRPKPKPLLAARSPRVRRGVRLAMSALLVCFLLTVVSWQAVSADLVDTPSTEQNGMLESSSWAFFAPNPPDAYSWYVLAATHQSEERVDLVDGGAVTFDRPPNAMDRYPSTLWKRYATKGRDAAGVLGPPAAEYFCRRAGDDVRSVTIYRVDQSVDAEGLVGEPARQKLATATCH